MGLGTLWATLQDLIPCEVRNAKRVQTNAPQAWAPMRGTLFGGGPCRGGLFELNAPPRQGMWAATTTIAMVRRMEWRPPLLYVNPSSHSISATLKISQKCVKQQPKNERAVRARCARGAFVSLTGLHTRVSQAGVGATLMSGFAIGRFEVQMRAQRPSGSVQSYHCEHSNVPASPNLICRSVKHTGCSCLFTHPF